jgi:hypothetical protein
MTYMITRRCQQEKFEFTLILHNIIFQIVHYLVYILFIACYPLHIWSWYIKLFWIISIYCILYYIPDVNSFLNFIVFMFCVRNMSTFLNVLNLHTFSVKYFKYKINMHWRLLNASKIRDVTKCFIFYAVKC